MMEERPLVADERLLENARQYKSELLGRMFGVTAFAAESEPEGTALPAGSNVLGVGFGAKVAAGAAVAGETAVRVYVREGPRGVLARAGGDSGRSQRGADQRCSGGRRGTPKSRSGCL